MSRNKQPDFSTYNFAPRTSLRQDIARFIAFARDFAPRVFVSYAEVCQRVNGFSRIPGINTNQVLQIRKNSAAVRRILMDKYDCGLITDPALGMRATVDATDMAGTQMVKASGRLRSAQDMFNRTYYHIDGRKIEDKDLRTWINQNIVPVAKAIASTDFATKLLPPKKEEDPNGSK